MTDVVLYTAAQAFPFVPALKDAGKKTIDEATIGKPFLGLFASIAAAFVSIASLLMLFLVGLGIRNQFKLK
jgi:hypothetical protein